jgi:hypothetical protein
MSAAGRFLPGMKVSLCLDGRNSCLVELLSWEAVGIMVKWSDHRASFYPWTAVHSVGDP